MPSIGFGEIIVILLVALVIFGPKKLPQMGRSIGQALREFRRSTSEVRAELKRGVEEEPPEDAPAGAREEAATGSEAEAPAAAPADPEGPSED